MCLALPAHQHLSRPCDVLLQGSITVNGAPMKASGLRAGFVQQDDLFYPQLTGKGSVQLERGEARPLSASPCVSPHAAGLS